MLKKNSVKPEAGVVVADDINDASGRLLVTAGTELTAKHLRALKMWGIGHVVVEVDVMPDDASGAQPALTPEQETSVLEYVNTRFRFTGLDDPVMARLFAYSLEKCKRMYLQREAEHVP